MLSVAKFAEAGDGGRGFESVSTQALDPIEVGSNGGPAPRAAPTCAEKFPRRPMQGLVAVKRDGARQPALAFERPTEKHFGRRDIPLCAENKID